MPNHIHGIIILTVGAGHCACPCKGLTIQGQPRGVAPTMKLSDVIHRFKSLTTTIYRQSVIHHKRKNDVFMINLFLNHAYKALYFI
jgi:hypothetical protein